VPGDAVDIVGLKLSSDVVRMNIESLVRYSILDKKLDKAPCLRDINASLLESWPDGLRILMRN